MKKNIKTLISKLQIVAITLCLALLSVNFVFAQNKYLRIKTERKADKCMFLVYEGSKTDVVTNKKNVLESSESSFVTKIDGTNIDEVVKFNERQKISDLVYKIIAPFYKNYKSKYEYEVEDFEIMLYSRIDGNVCELRFEYDRDANIPLTAIEKLENEILALGLKLEFDPNNHYAKDALWIYYPVRYSVSRMKEKLKAENK